MTTDDTTNPQMQALRHRFGDDPAHWPAPHRAEAATAMGRAGEAGSPAHATLLAAVAVVGDDSALGRAVLTRLGQPRPSLALRSQTLLSPLILSQSFAALLLVCVYAGYAVSGPAESGLLSLALGDGAPILDALQ